MHRIIITFYMCVCVCVFYRVTWDVMQLNKPSNIKTKPNQTKQKKAEISKTTNINVCTNNHTLL